MEALKITQQNASSHQKFRSHIDESIPENLMNRWRCSVVVDSKCVLLNLNYFSNCKFLSPGNYSFFVKHRDIVTVLLKEHFGFCFIVLHN